MTATTMIVVLAVARVAYGVPFPVRPGGLRLPVLSAIALLSLGLLLAAVVPTGRGADAAGRSCSSR